ncbi:MAG: glycine cleavage system protein GcvH [Proteobacteria bacterium]|mgnify:FL=1|jgi:glycine cleavage system H protein|nr:glycine cleavage system protein GcvH [Pseudomonadota bacterium]MBT6069536.1 glycine cleavage system protein GcvH [Pseudomonadota bacterium]MBT6657975.1 glycine cleavage system protein GcvH [Pseudomonadota bacterium]MBT6932058.1 glycine cleavage system protein GcvH [Pseudomonadota bacterium]MBT7109904.1 glycine cleavage system protein GcvH [Pseudomonadota bacterium]
MSDIKYTAEHAWARAEDNIVTVGITDFAQEQLGDLVFVELPTEGIEVAAGQEVVVIESVKAAGDIKSPISGTIVEINKKLLDSPEQVNDDPTGGGWFYRIKVKSTGDLDLLLDESEYETLVND